MTRMLIIGSGIAGSAAALAFAKAGIDAEIFEQHPRPADDVGVFLTLGSNGLDALSVIGLQEAALARGFATPVIELRSGTGKHLGTSRVGTVNPRGIPSQTMRRADLYGLLRDQALAAGVSISYDKKLASVSDTGDGVVAHFTDGTDAHGDILVGCDGLHSRTRNAIDPNAPPPTYAGLINYGGYTSGVATDAAPGAFRMIFGERAFFGYAVAPDQTVWWFVNEPTGASTADSLAALDESELREHLVELFRNDAGPAVDLIAAGHDLSRPTPIHLLSRLPRWHRDRMVVIGDAAHAPSPSSGQGASLSIEDAIVLAQCVRDLGAIPAALERFEVTRRARVERIVRAAARINNNKAATGIMRRIRDIALPIALRLASSKSVERTYGHHIDWHQKVA